MINFSRPMLWLGNCVNIALAGVSHCHLTGRAKAGLSQKCPLGPKLPVFNSSDLCLIKKDAFVISQSYTIVQLDVGQWWHQWRWQGCCSNISRQGGAFPKAPAGLQCTCARSSRLPAVEHNYTIKDQRDSHF